MIPLHDDNPTHRTPIVTVAIIVICTLVFFWQVTLGGAAGERIIYALGAIPAVLLSDAVLPPEIALIPPSLTVVTSMFLHGGWLHLIGNMLYLWIFGNNVEDAMGHAKFIVFYLVCGVAAALAHAFQDPTSTVPMVGASGAIAGVLGAYLLLHPHARVLVLLPLFIFFYTIRLPALIVIGFWIVLQVINAGLSGLSSGGVAWWAHVGGFVAGMILIPFFKEPGHPLFGRRSGSRPLPPDVLEQRNSGPWSRRKTQIRRRGPWG